MGDILRTKNATKRMLKQASSSLSRSRNRCSEHEDEHFVTDGGFRANTLASSLLKRKVKSLILTVASEGNIDPEYDFMHEDAVNPDVVAEGQEKIDDTIASWFGI